MGFAPARLADRRLQFVLLMMLTLAAWAPALGGRFQYDDLPNIVLDRATSDGAALLERLSNGFRPLLRLSYAADHFLWGFAPAGFLATNLLMHLLTVALVWRLAAHRLTDPLAAFCAALVFALQPAHGAAIAWASGRSTGLSTLWLACALAAHERGVLEGRARWRAASIGLMCLAVATKEVALVFPALVLLWEVTRATRPEPRQIWNRVAPSALAAIAALVILLCTSSRLRDLLLFSVTVASPAQALAAHLSALPTSFSLWFRPWALTVEHAPPALDPRLGGVALAALVAAAVAAFNRRPLLSLALLWPLAALLASHSVIARLDPVVEKSLYPAWIGPSLALGAGVAFLLRPRAGAAARALAIGTMAVLFAASGWRARVWADPSRLWQEATERAPLSARAWNNRAAAALGSGRSPDAVLRWLARARALDPHAVPLDADLAVRLSVRFEKEMPSR